MATGKQPPAARVRGTAIAGRVGEAPRWESFKAWPGEGNGPPPVARKAERRASESEVAEGDYQVRCMMSTPIFRLTRSRAHLDCATNALPNRKPEIQNPKQIRIPKAIASDNSLCRRGLQPNRRLTFRNCRGRSGAIGRTAEFFVSLVFLVYKDSGMKDGKWRKEVQG